MRETIDLLNFERLNADKELVICTIIGKIGSSYRALGAKKFIAADGSFAGLLSGGCLEGDILRAAMENRGAAPFSRHFSTLTDEDRLMGSQTGCKGVIEVLFEYLPAGRRPSDLELYLPYGGESRSGSVEVSLDEKDFGTRRLSDRKFTSPTRIGKSFFEPWQRPVELTLIGGGADVDPFFQLAHSMGWDVRVLDYRHGLELESRFPGGKGRIAPVEEIADLVREGETSAVVMMTHNYEADLNIMKGLAAKSLGYVGCLGPRERFETMKEDLVKFFGVRIEPAFETKVFAPAGIDDRNGSPSQIALSVLAQVQSVLSRRRPPPWTLILAAGEGKRFGGPKALARLEGRSLISIALERGREISGDRMVTVLGAGSNEIEAEIKVGKTTMNARWKEGMGTSIAHGMQFIAETDPMAEEVVLLLADQPRVPAGHIMELLSASRSTGRCALTSSDSYSAPPAVIPKRYFETARRLEGDQGLKQALTPADFVAVRNSRAIFDVDHPEHLTTLEST